MQVKALRQQQGIRETVGILKAILEEVRVLRKEMMFFFPQERIEEYEHANRINRSYEKAVKKHPPISSA